MAPCAVGGLDIMLDISIFWNWQSNRWRILKGLSGKLSTNWAWEVNTYATHSWVMLDAKFATKGDHRGMFIMIGLLGFALDVNIYDVRHEEE